MNYEKIGKFIQEERKKLNLTQDDLAKKIYVTNKAISKWENGRGLPNADSMVLLAKIFDISINELLAGKRLDEKEKLENANDLIISNLKDTQKRTFHFKILLGIILCLSLCALEVIIYMANIDEIYAYLIFGITFLIGFIIELATK